MGRRLDLFPAGSDFPAGPTLSPLNIMESVGSSAAKFACLIPNGGCNVPKVAKSVAPSETSLQIFLRFAGTKSFDPWIVEIFLEDL